MRREVSASIFAVLIVAAAILTVYYLNVGPTGFVVVGENATTFNTAGMVNLSILNDVLVLSEGNTSGTYTSGMFGNGSDRQWNNLTSGGSGVTFEVTICTTANCSDANFTTANLSNLNLIGKYFQYRVSFNETTDSLASVDLDFTPIAIPPALSISISEPSGEKNSLTAIPLTFTIAGGTGANLTCLYNINYAGGVLVQNTSVSCVTGSNTGAFDLADKGGDNTLTLYVSDSSGSISATSGFSVSIPGGTITGETVEEEETPAPVAAAPAISLVAEVPSQTISQGNSRGLSLLIQNTGTAFATSCVLSGDDSGFLAVDGSARDIADGNEVAFPFSVNVPNDAGVGQHTLGLSVSCANGVTASQTLVVDVLQKGLDLNITNVQRTRDDRVRVDYLLMELTGEDQDVQILFTITDASGLEVANASQNSSVDANSTDDFRVNIPINETLEGNLTLSAAFNSQIYSSSVLEPISLGTVTGGAIFGGEGGAGGIIIVLVVAAVLVAVFFVARRLRAAREK